MQGVHPDVRPPLPVDQQHGGPSQPQVFLLFVAYMAASSFYMAATAFPASRIVLRRLLQPTGPPNVWAIARGVNWLGAHATSGLFAASLAPFLFFHLRLAVQNKTTIEFLEKQDQLRTAAGDGGRHLYDLGSRENLIALFGPEWYLWLLPVPTTPGDGVHFPTVLDAD
eukprot:TRINITY_DN12342_c0_g1_i1.p1 TRINITY_DN12342_c0_g1~~TRINITY_DN12342_c0_g1_i1.p1  ORF type:complete len:168 (-),score=47.28 TRINITY_DN12342_c0_g1_i1:43-546(-)